MERIVRALLKKEKNMNQKLKTAQTLGIISLIAWLLPVAGLPISIIGLVKSGAEPDGHEDEKRASAARTMSIIGLVLSSINAFLGFLMACA
jgi:hypothetical protein